MCQFSIATPVNPPQYGGIRDRSRYDSSGLCERVLKRGTHIGTRRYDSKSPCDHRQFSRYSVT